MSAQQLWANFESSRFATMKPLMVEQPFTLYIGSGVSLTGRIDAIYEGRNGGWEIVDFKTGTGDPDPLQLQLYRLAVWQIWQKDADCGWLLLRDGAEKPLTPSEVDVNTLEDAARRLAGSSDRQ